MNATTTSGAVGGITGDNQGLLSNVLANGLVVNNGAGIASIGGVTGTDNPDDFTITDSYFNTETTGQTVSGEDDSSVSGPSDLGAEAVTTAFLQDALAFFTSANAQGWILRTSGPIHRTA